jgi:L-glutamine-phosphate cytidylyltransferase
MTGSKPEKPRAIILSAGQGRRLLPLTENTPKCLLPILGKPIVEWQIDALLANGISEITVVTGFQSSLVEAVLQRRYANLGQINVLFNPFFAVADNLASCWIARFTMDRDFVLLNGDTVFEEALLARVLGSEPAPITLSVDRKATYDADDMKVQLAEAEWVEHVNKTMPADQIDAESVGLIFFREHGPQEFRSAVELALRNQAELKSWYLTIIDALAEKRMVKACSISNHRWCEIDFRADLARAEALFGNGQDESLPKASPSTELIAQE